LKALAASDKDAKLLVFAGYDAESQKVLGTKLADDELYAGLILNDDGTPSHHLVLLPGDNDEATWDASKAWANSCLDSAANWAALAPAKLSSTLRISYKS
jgi:hypothetical protein